MVRPSRLPNTLALLTLSILACRGASGARASDGELVRHVAVLAIGSDGLHDELARKLGDALRRQLAATAGYQVSDARVSLEQLSLVQDCDSAEDGCLALIAKQLGVGALVHGTLKNEGSGALAELALFEQAGQSGKTGKRTAMTMFAVRDASDRDVARKVTALLDQLFRPIGAEAVSGSEALPASEDEWTAPPEDSGPPLSGKRVLGYALLGGAALSAGLSVLAFVEIDRAQGNESFDRYRRAVGTQSPLAKDVCDEAEANRSYGIEARRFDEVKSECSSGRTFEVLQFVFLGAAAVSGGLSAYFLLSEDATGERKRQSALSLPFQPIVKKHGAELRARLRF